MAICFLPGAPEAWVTEICAELRVRLKELGLPTTAVPVHEDVDSLPAESVVLFCGEGPAPSIDEVQPAVLKAHQKSCVVIPVLDELGGARQKLPTCLQDLNAIAVGTSVRSYGELIQEILSRLWSRRRKRRIFLSYKRTDSAGVAHQLHDALTHRGYEVFLDQFVLHAAEPVQREIFWSLNDSDLLLLLDSPNAGDSSWVEDEISLANAMSVPILALQWPGLPGSKALFPDQAYPLPELELDPLGEAAKSRLRDSVLRDVLSEAVPTGQVGGGETWPWGRAGGGERHGSSVFSLRVD